MNIETEVKVCLLQPQMESPFILDATTLPAGVGAIIFNGNKMPTRNGRRFWVLERAGTVKFTLDSNDLKLGTRLTISGFLAVKYDSLEYLDEVYIK